MKNCYRCNKLLIHYYEIMDTKDGRKIKLCQECGEEYTEWINKERKKHREAGETLPEIAKE